MAKMYGANSSASASRYGADMHYKGTKFNSISGIIGSIAPLIIAGLI